MAGNLASRGSVEAAGAQRSLNGFRHEDADDPVPIEARRRAGRDPTENGWIPLAKSGQAARAAKREMRVAARGAARNQAARRSTLIAAAVATCWRCVLASPR